MEINQYAVTASEMKDLSFLDIDQYVSAGVYQSQKVPVSLVKALMLSENIEQILLADMQALAVAGDLVSLKNYLIDDGSTLYLVMAAGGVGNQIYQYAIDVTSGLFGTFDLVTGVFTPASGNANIVEITSTDLAALESANTLSLTTIYIVTDAAYRIAMKAEASNKLGANGTIIDLSYSGFVYYYVQSNNITNGVIIDEFANMFNGILPTDVTLGASGGGNIFYRDAISNVLGASCIYNTFEQYANNNQLGDDCSYNTFEQGANTNYLRKYCYNNTFKQGANGFIFFDNLLNVTIEAGVSGGDYSDPVAYAFLYNKPYASTIFTDDVYNYHRWYDPANDRIVVTNLSTLVETYIGGTAPNIQQVLDTGNTSTTAIKIDNGTGNYVQVNSSNILMEDSSGNALSVYPDSMTIQNPSFGAGTIKATALANNVTFELPNKAAGTQTFAMLSDISGGGGDVYLANDQTFTGENTFAIASGSKEPIVVTKGGSGAAIKVTKSSGSGDAIEVADGSVSIADETASTIAHFDGSKRIKSLATSTYPSLTELARVKGVGSQVVGTTDTNTLTNKRITARIGTTTSSATPTINTDNVDFYSLTAQTVDITSFTTNLSGTPTDGQTLWIAITGTAARAITWGASFESSTITLPTTTVTTARLDVAFIWNAVTSKWRCVGTC
jgi:hypothetical protein